MECVVTSSKASGSIQPSPYFDFAFQGWMSSCPVAGSSSFAFPDHGDFFASVQNRHLGRAAEPPHVERSLRGRGKLVERFYLVRPYCRDTLTIVYFRRSPYRNRNGQYVPALQSRVSAEGIQRMSKLYNAFAVRCLLKGAFRRRQRQQVPSSNSRSCCRWN